MGKGEYLYTMGKLLLFRHSIVKEITSQESKLLFKSTCDRKCHSFDVIERARHTRKEWTGIVRRMQEANGLKITRPVEQAVIEYVTENYFSTRPTLLSPEDERFLKKHWKADFGEGDLYIDVFYTTPKIARVLGNTKRIGEKNLKENLVFTIYENTHSGKLYPYPLDKVAVLRIDGKEYKPVPDSWQVIYESFDFHHREGILSFPGKDKDGKPVLEGDARIMEIIIRDVKRLKEMRASVPQERVYTWDLSLLQMRESEPDTLRKAETQES
jgi:hypothetical protein